MYLSALPSPGNPGYEQIKQTCATARAAERIKIKTIEVKFPNPGRVCDWGAYGKWQIRFSNDDQ